MSLVRAALLAVLIAGLSLPALAQTVVRVRGTVESLDANTLTVKTREGPSVKIALADNYTVAAVVPVELVSIAAGSYIGTAAMCKPEGCTALEVLVFPEAMKGTGEGRFPWDLAPESTMINASVSTVSAGAGTGRELVVTHKGETSKVMVPVGVPIVTFVPADRSLLKAGTPVFIGSQKAADGSLSAARVRPAQPTTITNSRNARGSKEFVPHAHTSRRGGVDRALQKNCGNSLHIAPPCASFRKFLIASTYFARPRRSGPLDRVWSHHGSPCG